MIYQKEKALWKARNFAVKKSDSDYLLFFDDDSRVNSEWVINHLKCIFYLNISISSGVSFSAVGGKIPEFYNYIKFSNQIDTGNVMIKKDVFNKVGFFDQSFEGQRMGDGEFGMRCYLNGYKNISNCYAGRNHLKAVRRFERKMGSWDGMRPVNWLSARPIPSVLYFWRKYWGKRLAIYGLLSTIPLSLSPYNFKGKSMGIS